jgi:N utilization substance protein B
MKVKAAARGRARRIAMQALYQWHMTDNALNVIESECHVENDMQAVDTEYFSEIFRGVAKDKTDLDGAFSPFLVGVSFDKLDPISLAVLRLATFELKHRIDVPYRVVINEAINLTKKYGAADSHKFVNGVLDKVAPLLREAEVKANNKN